MKTVAKHPPDSALTNTSGAFQGTYRALMQFVLIVTALVLVSSHVQAQSGTWTVTRLHPSGATRSVASEISGSAQVGSAFFGGRWEAGMWAGSTESWTSLHPAGAPSSNAFGVRGANVVGLVGFHARLWDGASFWTDIHPNVAGVSSSRADDVFGTQQVGQVQFNTGSMPAHACLWNGSAASWVDLHPAIGTEWSAASATTGSEQVGTVYVGADPHASLWRGTAASWVDLNPPNACNSWANGADEGRQVGRAYCFGDVARASMWLGTPESWIDLHPAIGASESEAFDVFGEWQVGWTYAGTNQSRACIWRGTAASWVDLHQFIPSTWTESKAYGVWSDGAVVRVVGYGHNNVDNRDEALLWTLQNPIGGCDSIDFNNDTSSFDPQDIEAFLSKYSEGPCIPATATCNDIDFNNDTSVFDPCDINSFLVMYSEGPCTACGV